MSDLELQWAPPSICRRCRHPVAAEGERCLNCGAPLRLLSGATSASIGRAARSALSLLGEVLINTLLIGAGLYICWRISPFLLLFPLFFVFTQGSQK